MSHHRKKRAFLSQPEIDQFLADAERLNATISRPPISPQCLKPAGQPPTVF
jgi:hypothetical protein